MPIWSSYCRDAKPTCAWIFFSAWTPVWPSVLGRVKEMSVSPVSSAETFWTIMSMLIAASEQAWKIGRLAGVVRDADHGDLGLAAVVGHAGDDRGFHVVSFVVVG